MQVNFEIFPENTPDMVYPFKAISIVDSERLKKLILMKTNEEGIN